MTCLKIDGALKKMHARSRFNSMLPCKHFIVLITILGHNQRLFRELRCDHLKLIV